MNWAIAAVVLLLAVADASANELILIPDITTSRFPTAKDAETAVLAYVINDTNNGLSATQALSAKLSFALGHNIEGFGKRGDRVWQIHFVEGGETKRIAWIDAENGKVKFIYPQEE